MKSTKLLMLVSVLGLSTTVWSETLLQDVDTETTAVVTDTGRLVGLGTSPLTSWWSNGKDYLLTDKNDGHQSYLAGVNGTLVDDTVADMDKDYSAYYGDTLTDLHTSRSGVITGVAHEGTMDVASAKTGKVVRYQYVTFKVNPVYSK